MNSKYGSATGCMVSALVIVCLGRFFHSLDYAVFAYMFYFVSIIAAFGGSYLIYLESSYVLLALVFLGIQSALMACSFIYI